MGDVRKGWGKGKVEVLALKGEIIALFDQGMNASEAHEHLATLGKLKLSYRAFARHVKAIREQSPTSSSPERIQRETAIATNAVIDSSLAQLREKVKPASSNSRKFVFDQNLDVAALMERSDDTPSNGDKDNG